MSGKQMTLFEESEIQWSTKSHKPIFSEWSHSRRETLEKCARKYYYEYYGSNLRKAKEDPQKEKLHFLEALGNRNLRTGNILHLVIKTYLNKLRRGEEWSLNRLLHWARKIYHADLEYSGRYKHGTPLPDEKYPPTLLLEFYYGWPDAESLSAEAGKRLVLNRKSVRCVNFKKYVQRSNAMIETNIRIVEPGVALTLLTRCAKIKTLAPSVKMLEKVCNQFASRNLAAIYCPQRQQILVLTPNLIRQFVVKDDKENWIAEVVDGKKNQNLQFSRSKNDALLLAQLIERQIIIGIKRRSKMKTFDSPRIFQATRPFKTVRNIDAYRRFEVSAIPIEGVGVGISVEISTAFFTHNTIADIFRDDIPNHEQQRRQEDFESLSQRQRGQKGTLLYDLENKQRKCYFDKFLPGVTCATTGTLFVNEQTYSSLFEYYKHNQPQLKIDPNDSVAMVSFRGMNQPQPVAAKLLRLRVMNDSLPSALKQVDKITPWERLRLIDSFWQRLGNDILGNGKPRVSRYFWQPRFKKVIKLLPPALQFADGLTLSTPRQRSSSEFQEHYRQRLRLLHKGGCLDTLF